MARNKGSNRDVRPDRPPSFTDKTLSNSITKVYVGPDRELYLIYTDLLRYWSNYLDGEFDVSNSETLDLPTVSPAVFRVFLDWMRSDGDQLPKWSVHEPRQTYGEPIKVGENEVIKDRVNYYHSQPESEALECYMFAIDFEIRQFQNDLFDSILEMNPDGNLVPSYSIILKVWQASTPAPLLRKYLVDVFARNWTYGIDAGCREELILRKQVPADFWLSVLLLRDEHGEIDDYPPWDEDLCQYHNHTDEEQRSCYWQNINGGSGYCTDYTDDDDDDSMLDEYESDFIDDTGVYADEVPGRELSRMEEDDTGPVKMEAELDHEHNGSDIGETSGSLTI
ncbi:uncharacterized protein BKCO1_6900018 [Diplodia corticola]|uniref:BTB domain-containing protein n=1 Tax=Diplodia corticola TaxID=236234 RepID=A0A1J9QND0_9PEZI|nr:uncharacterized protein BKCO1_6900018 [Diplodia corticola]OJD29968.1 hypothetical protein BKCO1_6900018 [Diplodia corticola]